MKIRKNANIATFLQRLRQVSLGLALVLLCFAGSALYSKPAAAACCGCNFNCFCVLINHGLCGIPGTTRDVICSEHDDTRDHITDEFQKHQRWIFYTFFREHVLRAWMKLTEQLSAIGMQQVEIIGAFLMPSSNLKSSAFCKSGKQKPTVTTNRIPSFA